MNEVRRKEVEKAISLVEEAQSIIESIATAEREEYDDLPEKSQESDKATKIDAAASSLEEAQDDCDSLINKLNDAKV